VGSQRRRLPLRLMLDVCGMRARHPTHACAPLARTSRVPRPTTPPCAQATEAQALEGRVNEAEKTLAEAYDAIWHLRSEVSHKVQVRVSQRSGPRVACHCDTCTPPPPPSLMQQSSIAAARWEPGKQPSGRLVQHATPQCAARGRWVARKASWCARWGLQWPSG